MNLITWTQQTSQTCLWRLLSCSDSNVMTCLNEQLKRALIIFIPFKTTVIFTTSIPVSLSIQIITEEFTMASLITLLKIRTVYLGFLQILKYQKNTFLKSVQTIKDLRHLYNINCNEVYCV